MPRRLVIATGTAALVVVVTAPSVGELTHAPEATGIAGCVSETDSGDACQDGTALENALGVTTTADGKSVYVASDVSDAIAVFVRDSASGALTQNAGAAGCVSETGTGGLCRDGRALNAPNSVAASADGKSVYAASIGSDAIAIFDRSPATGALIQKPGIAGCISETSSRGACHDGRALDGALDVAVSTDGKSVYVASQLSDAVAIFDRDPATGALTQKVGAAGCVSDTGTNGLCKDGNALDGILSIAPSADGMSVYAASTNSDAVAILDRNPATGALVQKDSTAACVSKSGAGMACRDGNALDSAAGVATSADGKSVYVASQRSDAVAIFDRDPATGALTQKAGDAGCISENGAGSCRDGMGLDGAISIAVSPDDSRVYATAIGSDAVVVFDRDLATGALVQSPGTAGCISRTGVGPCRAGTALDFARDITATPNGNTVYVASAISDAVVIFDDSSGGFRLVGD
jgi:DNA-binding beta-propeller fold protein YncE